MTTIQIVLTVIAVLAMLKAVWILATPAGFKRCITVWLRIAGNLPTLLPVVLAAIGVALWILILIGQPVYMILTALFGALFVLSAVMHADRENLERMVHRVALDRAPWVLRVMAVITLLVAALVLWIALKAN